MGPDRIRHGQDAVPDAVRFHSSRPVQHLDSGVGGLPGLAALGEDHGERGVPVHLAAQMAQGSCLQCFLSVGLRGGEVAKLPQCLGVL
jgi:hypothetical protein